MTELEQQLQTRLDKAVEVFKQKEAEIAELRATIESKDKAYQILQDTYNQVFAELNKLREEHEMLNKKYAKRKEQIAELQSQLSWADEDNEYLQNRNETLEKVNGNLSQALKNSLNINEIMSQQKKEYAEIPVSFTDKEKAKELVNDAIGEGTSVNYSPMDSGNMFTI